MRRFKQFLVEYEKFNPFVPNTQGTKPEPGQKWNQEPDYEGEYSGCEEGIQLSDGSWTTNVPLWQDPYDYERSYCQNCMAKLKQLGWI